jgi:hypothetical protein
MQRVLRTPSDWLQLIDPDLLKSDTKYCTENSSSKRQRLSQSIHTQVNAPSLSKVIKGTFVSDEGDEIEIKDFISVPQVSPETVSIHVCSFCCGPAYVDFLQPRTFDLNGSSRRQQLSLPIHTQGDAPSQSEVATGILPPNGQDEIEIVDFISVPQDSPKTVGIEACS